MAKPKAATPKKVAPKKSPAKSAKVRILFAAWGCPSSCVNSRIDRHIHPIMQKKASPKPKVVAAPVGIRKSSRAPVPKKLDEPVPVKAAPKPGAYL